MFKLIMVIALAIFGNAAELKLEDGVIKAHTEVFGDSTIDPETKSIKSFVKIGDSIESITGEFEISPLSLVSDNKDRDSHMYEVLNAKSAPTINFYITNISKVEDKYKIDGILKMNYIKKNISSLANISDIENKINMSGDFSIKLTDFNLEPPTMFFLTVRDQIDIAYNFSFKKD